MQKMTKEEEIPGELEVDNFNQTSDSLSFTKEAQEDVIFVIDDNPINLKLVYAFLKNSGLKVLVSQDGISGINKIKKILPDLILLDILMPEIDGFEICKKLKKLPLTKDIPIIFMTALTDIENKIKGLNLGAVDYIGKPFNKDELLARVKLHLKLRKLTKQLELQNLALKIEIEERHRVESELRLSEEKFFSIFHAIPDPVYITTIAEGILVDVNESFCQFTGYEREEVLGKIVSDLTLFRNEKKISVSLIEEILINNNSQTLEIIWTNKDNLLKIVLLSAQTININDKKCLVTVAKDITERKLAEIKLEQNEQNLRLIIETNVNGIVLIDHEGQIIFVNKAAEYLFNKPREELLGQYFGLPLIKDESTEINIIHNVDKVLTILMRSVEINWNNKKAFLLSLFDLTERKKTEEKLQIFLQAVEQSPVSIVITNAEGIIEYVNPKFEKISGYYFDEVIGKNPRILKSGYTTQEEYKKMWEALFSGQEWQGEFNNKRKDGELYWEQASISPIKNSEGLITHFVAVKEDITLRKQQEEKLHHQANYDSLTNLPNRMLVMDRLQQAIKQAERSQQRVGLIFVDLDHFKEVNDTMGHEWGDKLLQEVAHRLGDCVRKSDTVARLGGDEFLMVFSPLDNPLQLEIIATKLIKSLKEPFDLAQEIIHISASLGITIYPDDGYDCGILMRNADTAMYAAKNQGRNAFKFFQTQMNEWAQTKKKIENYLRYAIKNNELSVVYQPFIDLKTGNIIGAEALMRWNSIHLGTVKPDVFIPIAEETGLIDSLGEQVLSIACKEAARWKSDTVPYLLVAVNISPHQFKNPDFLKIVSENLEKSKLYPNFLELEITERVLLDQTAQVFEIMKQLQSHNVQISIDDFGTGYSSLSYLKKFPLKVLKIDKSFIVDLPKDREMKALVRAIITMAHGLRLKVVAEGVEKPEQALFLAKENCDYAQGYLFSKPVTAKDFSPLLNHNYFLKE